MNAPEILEDFESSEALLAVDECEEIENCQNQIEITKENTQEACDKFAGLFWLSKFSQTIRERINMPEILEDFESSEALLVADACNVMDEDFSNEITINNIPQLIGDTFKRLEEIQKRILDCQDKTKKAKEKAEAARNKRPRRMFNKAAIESLQNAGNAMAEAQASSFELQTLMFGQQNCIAKAVEGIFLLTCGNIDLTRQAVEGIEKGLQEASKHEISIEAREKLKKLCKQLYNQLDLMKKQEKLKERVSELEAVIDDFREELTLLKSNTDYNKSILKQKKLSIILWCTVVGVLINFCGIIAVLYIVLK